MDGPQILFSKGNSEDYLPTGLALDGGVFETAQCSHTGPSGT